MIVLGLDTATPATAVALRLDDGRTLQARDDPPAGEHPGHATRLLEMAHTLLAQADVAWSQVERIAVGVGPGTFTGLRVGVATARGLAQSLSVEIVGISSPMALAAAAFATVPSDAILAVIDARRGEVFAAAYERDDGGRAPRQLTDPCALAPEDLAAVVEAAEGSSAACDRRWLAIGDGALRFSSQLRAAGIAYPPGCSPLHRVSAGAICALAVTADPAVSLEQVLPDYRRRPDAELALQTAGASPAGER